MDDKGIERRLHVLLEDMGAEVAAQGIRPYRARLRTILQDASRRETVDYDGEAVYAGTTSYSERDKIAQVIDFVAHDIQRRGAGTTATSYEKAHRLVDAVRRLPHPDRADAGPDVVPQSEVNDLPEGSLVVGVSAADSLPSVGANVTRIGPDSRISLYGRYRVLHRAPEKPVAVGDVITGKRANTLPNGSIIKSASGTFPNVQREGGYVMGPDTTPCPVPSDMKFRVLHLGGK